MNVLTVFSAMAPYVRGRSLSELFPAHFMQNLPFNRIQQGCCIFCIRPMAYEEMFPPDRLTPRAICPECWAALTANISEACWVCGNYLEDWKINQQRIQLSELHFRIHGEKCGDYFSLCSAQGLGQHTGIRDALSPLNYSQHTPNVISRRRSVTPEHEFIDAEYEGLNSLPLSRNDARALPPPTELLKLQHQMNELHNIINRTLNNKRERVKIVSKPKGRGRG